MRRGELVHVEDFAIRAAPVVIRRPVPARHAGLREQGLGVGSEFIFWLSGGLGGRLNL